MAITEYGPISWERIIGAANDVRRRLTRAVNALQSNEIPYAVIGGNCVAAWVRRHGQGGERGTPNVDVLVDRRFLCAAAAALLEEGFQQTAEPYWFLEAADDGTRQRIRIFVAEERVKSTDLLPLPATSRSVEDEIGRIIALDALAEMKLSSYRTIDRVHLRDMIDVGLIDETWIDRIPPLLRHRLRETLDDPDG